MAERITDLRITRTIEDPLGQAAGDYRAMAEELRTRRAADLSAEEVEALVWARAAVARSPWSVSPDCPRALAILDRLTKVKP